MSNQTLHPRAVVLWSLATLSAMLFVLTGAAPVLLAETKPVGTGANGTNSQPLDALLRRIEALEAQHPPEVPIGSILAFAGTQAPAGWRLCNGDELAMDAYPELFAVVGTSFGRGTQPSLFRLPDLRGRFLRGVDGGTGRDPDASSRAAMGEGGSTGDTPGTIQADALGQHSHGNPSIGMAQVKGGSFFKTDQLLFGKAWWIQEGSHSTAAFGESETRPKNASVNWIVRVK